MNKTRQIYTTADCDKCNFLTGGAIYRPDGLRLCKKHKEKNMSKVELNDESKIVNWLESLGMKDSPSRAEISSTWADDLYKKDQELKTAHGEGYKQGVEDQDKKWKEVISKNFIVYKKQRKNPPKDLEEGSIQPMILDHIKKKQGTTMYSPDPATKQPIVDKETVLKAAATATAMQQLTIWKSELLDEVEEEHRKLTAELGANDYRSGMNFMKAAVVSIIKGKI